MLSVDFSWTSNRQRNSEVIGCSKGCRLPTSLWKCSGSDGSSCSQCRAYESDQELEIDCVFVLRSFQKAYEIEIDLYARIRELVVVAAALEELG